MRIEDLKKMDRIVRKAGTREPEDVLESIGYQNESQEGEITCLYQQ